MKIKLLLSKATYDEIRSDLEGRGIEISDDAKYVLSEVDSFGKYLNVRNKATNEKTSVSLENIIYIESYGHNVEVHAMTGTFLISEPLYKIMGNLSQDKFIRVSSSVIVSKKQIKTIRPTLGRKFVLTMSDKTLIDVTRTYYNLFKESIGF